MKEVCITYYKHTIHVCMIDLWMHQFYSFLGDDQVMMMML